MKAANGIQYLLLIGCRCTSVGESCPNLLTNPRGEEGNGGFVSLMIYWLTNLKRFNRRLFMQVNFLEPVWEVEQTKKVQECIPVGCIPSATVVVSKLGGSVCLGVCLHTVVSDREVPRGRVWPGGRTPPPPPLNRMTDMCKNITFP